MNVVPNKKADKVAFFAAHIAPWNSHAVEIGTTAAAVTDLETKVETALAALDAQLAAEQAAKAATLTANEAVTDMGRAGADIIKSIRAKAAVAGNGVYALAQIPAPSTPTPVGPPGMPYDFTATLDPTGQLSLAWKCNNPAGATGTVYQVSRQVGTTGTMQIIGAAGDKKFIDATLPIGSTQVTYRIMALRSTVAGTPNEFTVKFGVTGGGEMTASVVAAPKMAA